MGSIKLFCRLLWNKRPACPHHEPLQTFDVIAGISSGVSPHQTCGGWVNDSEPEAEFQETVDKGKAMLKAVALAETFTKK